MTNARDNFTAPTKRVLATRVACRCCNPECDRPTIGPSSDEGKTINLGEAAHITAAAPGGKRYDANLTPEQRSSASNGIWLCSYCAGLIDSDENRYPTSLLQKWKADAIERAFKRLVTGEIGFARPSVGDRDASDEVFIRSLGLPAKDDIDGVFERAASAVLGDIASFIGTPEWPAHPLELDMTIDKLGSDETHLEGLAAATAVADFLGIVAPPGMGKSTTLIQLAEKITSVGNSIPALVPLGEWSARQDDFFAHLCRRGAFRGFLPQHFMQLAYYGRLTLLLDGWNELDSVSRLRAVQDLKALRRDYPTMSIVVATRRQLLPFEGPVAEIQLLSSDQQVELARSLKGEAGVALIDRAWRTAGVRDLVAIPLYLHALLMGSDGEELPRTKEEVLRLFVGKHEQGPERQAIFEKDLHGFQREMLIGLGVEATKQANTTISIASARSAIHNVEEQLAANGQLRNGPEPGTVLNLLISVHALVRPPSDTEAVSFQHQQFQEWYASLEVERLMRLAGEGDDDAWRTLREEILNWPAWEEAILFACERMSPHKVDSCLVTKLVQEAMNVDPILAADMIYVSTSDVWDQVKGDVVPRISAWHMKGRVDRAVRFMITSGKPEFAEYVWPLIESSDDQIYLDALRSARRFRPSVLGPEAAVRLAKLPPEMRGHVVGEIADRSGYDGMDLAAALAATEGEPDVVAEILTSLLFRRGDRLAQEVLRGADEAVWLELVRRGYPEHLSDPTLDKKLADLRNNALQNEEDSARLLFNLSEQRDAKAESKIEAIVVAADFSARDPRFNDGLRHAFQIFPEAVARGLRQQLSEGRVLPFSAEEMVAGLPVVDEGPIAEGLVKGTLPKASQKAAAAIVGPETISEVLGNLLRLETERREKGRDFSQADNDEYHRLIDALAISPDNSFFSALSSFSASTDPHEIRLMASLLPRRSDRDGVAKAAAIGGARREELVSIISRWMDLISSPGVSRHLLYDVARAAGWLGDERLLDGVEKLLQKDLNDWAEAKKKYAEGVRRGPISPDISHSYLNQYAAAFVGLRGPATTARLVGYLADHQFGFDAAVALLQIYQKDHPNPEKKGFSGGGVDFSQARRLRKQKADGDTPTSDFAEAIFEIAQSMGVATASSEEQLHAIKLAQIGLAMPHGMKSDLIRRLVSLPQRYAAKHWLMAAAAAAGELLSADEIGAGMAELMEEAKTQSWRLQDDRGELMGWIDLLPFSDRPSAVFEALDLLKPHQRQPHRLRGLLSTLANSPEPEALPVLLELGRRDKDFYGEYEWLQAFVKSGTEQSALALLEFVQGDGFSTKRGADTYRIAQWLGGSARDFPRVKKAMLDGYLRMGPGPGKATIERALAELGDVDVIVPLIKAHAADKRLFEGNLSRALALVAIHRKPVEGWPNAFSQEGAPVATLRKELFALWVSEGPEGALARECLEAIDEMRDQYGRADGEPRHPDVSSDRPWPPM